MFVPSASQSSPPARLARHDIRVGDDHTTRRLERFVEDVLRLARIKDLFRLGWGELAERREGGGEGGVG